MAVLTEQEKVRIRHHLGYLNVQEASTFVLGTPSSVETQFIIEGAFNRVLESAVPLLRDLLGKLNATEEQMFCGQENMALLKIGEITMNSTGEDREQKELRRSYEYWKRSMANILGVMVNPFDKRTGVYRVSGGISVGVRH